MPEEKLWVYDTLTFLHVYAESQDQADAEAFRLGGQIGVEFYLATDWETYQSEYKERMELEDAKI